jgi:hypothetical protein
MLLEDATLPATGLEDRVWVAQNLVGRAEPDALCKAFEFEQLVILGAGCIERIEEAKKELLQYLLTILWKAGPLPSDRAKAINEYADALAKHTTKKYSQRYMRKFAALVLTIHPDKLEGEYSEAGVSHAMAAVESTSVEGEDPYSPSRAARAEAVLAESIDRNLSCEQTRRLGQEYARQDEARRLNPDLEEVPLSALLTPEPYWKKSEAEFRKAVDTTFRAEMPGTWPDTIDAAVQAFQTLSARWIISPR